MVKPLSVAQARDAVMTQKYRSWQKLWESGKISVNNHPLPLMNVQLGSCTRLSESGMQQLRLAITKICFIYLYLLALPQWNEL
jgi:hypothetical protein